MLEARIRIDRDLIIKGHKKAYGLKTLGEYASFYSWRLLVVWLAIAVVDGLKNQGDLIGLHLYVIAGFAVAGSVHGYYDWVKRLSQSARDWELHVVLDDEGVILKNENDRRIDWDSYIYFKEYEDYLEITHSSGEISFLPKKDEIADVIVFTKSKIPAKGLQN